MKYLHIYALLLCAVMFAWSEEFTRQMITVTFGDNGVIRGVGTNNMTRGFVEEVYVVPGASSQTNIVQLYAQPEVPGMSTFDVLSATTINGAYTIRPRVAATTVGGVTTNVSTKILLVGETLYLSVTNVSVTSNNTVRCIIKTSKGN